MAQNGPKTDSYSLSSHIILIHENKTIHIYIILPYMNTSKMTEVDRLFIDINVANSHNTIIFDIHQIIMTYREYRCRVD
jgi:hypothetical protein